MTLSRLSHLTRRALLLGLLAGLLGACGKTMVVADRTVINNIPEPVTGSFVVHALDPAAQSQIEFMALADSFSKDLTDAGLTPATGRPDMLFLIGYAVEMGINAAWERTLVVVGYDTVNRRRVYMTKLVSEGSDGSIVNVGKPLLAKLAADLRISGSRSDQITVPLTTE